MEVDRHESLAENAVMRSVNDDIQELLPEDLPEYQPRTFRLSSVTSERRRALLPAYPLGKFDTRPTVLLLANVHNVDREQLEMQSYSGGMGFCPFELQAQRVLDPIDSFMMDFYQNLYILPSQRWNINLGLIDYNLLRMRKCMEKYTQQTGVPALLSLDELPMALEFYLQMDGKAIAFSFEPQFIDIFILVYYGMIVDLFFMKTCRFRGARPRLLDNNKQEGILCHSKPVAHYGTQPCRQERCLLCKTRRSESGVISTVVHFSPNQIHHFVNSYQAILNCPAVSFPSIAISTANEYYFRHVEQRILSMFCHVLVVNVISSVRHRLRFVTKWHVRIFSFSRKQYCLFSNSHLL